MIVSLCVFAVLFAAVLGEPPCTDIEFGCPEGYECDVPREGCPSHCHCRDPGTNATVPQGCPIHLKPCDGGQYCQPERVGDCFSCNCDTPCADITGEFCCLPKKGEACTRRLERGSCPVCKCDACPSATDCPEDCFAVNLDAGCRSVCVCSTKAGAPFVFLGVRSVTLPPELLQTTTEVTPNQAESATSRDGGEGDAAVTRAPTTGYKAGLMVQRASKWT